MVQWLVNEGGSDNGCGIDEDYSTLSYAVQNGHLHIVKWLLEHGGALAHGDDIYPNHPLLVAASCGFDSIVTYLLSVDGRMIYETCGEGWTAVSCALDGGHIPLVELLLSEGGRLGTENGCSWKIFKAGSTYFPSTIQKFGQVWGEKALKALLLYDAPRMETYELKSKGWSPALLELVRLADIFRSRVPAWRESRCDAIRNSSAVPLDVLGIIAGYAMPTAEETWAAKLWVDHSRRQPRPRGTSGKRRRSTRRTQQPSRFA